MINTRAIATLGFGFGAAAIAAIGLVLTVQPAANLHIKSASPHYAIAGKIPQLNLSSESAVFELNSLSVAMQIKRVPLTAIDSLAWHYKIAGIDQATAINALTPSYQVKQITSKYGVISYAIDYRLKQLTPQLSIRSFNGY